MKKIVCFHLYNDYSGSPKVLAMTLKGILDNSDYNIDIVTSKGNGILSELTESKRVRLRGYKYTFSDNHIKTFVSYIRVQFITFFMALKYIFDKDTVFYINTLLPAGPALAGKLTGKRVIYHYHENADIKGGFYKMLAKWMQVLADRIICVSEYQKSFLKRQDKCIVVPNALPNRFTESFKGYRNDGFDKKTVMMLSSLKEYKGTAEFFRLAGMLPQYRFVVIINDNMTNIERFIIEHNLEKYPNIEYFDRQSDVIPFYKKASIVLNLSNKNQFIETFGLTALEAMTAGLPVIVPTVGGIAEMVEDGVNGYKIDVQELEKIKERISEILENRDLYMKLSANAFKFADKYSENNMIDRILSVLNKQTK